MPRGKKSQTKTNALKPNSEIKTIFSSFQADLNRQNAIDKKDKIVPKKIQEFRSKKMEAIVNDVIIKVSKPLNRTSTISRVTSNQTITDFCVGCTISRHFITSVLNILKIALGENYNEIVDIQFIFDLFLLYKYRLFHTTDVDTGTTIPIKSDISISYLTLSLFANELNQNSITIINETINFGYAVPYDIRLADHPLFKQTGAHVPLNSNLVSFEQLNAINILNESIHKIVQLLNICSKYMATNDIMLQLEWKTQIEKTLTKEYLIEHGQNSIISLGSREYKNDNNLNKLNNWNVLGHPPRDGFVTFSDNDNNGTQDGFHSIFVYNVEEDVLILQNSYEDQGILMESLSGAEMSGLKYHITDESMKYIFDIMKLILVERSDYWKKFKGGKTKTRKGRRKTRKQNKLK